MLSIFFPHSSHIVLQKYDTFGDFPRVTVQFANKASTQRTEKWLSLQADGEMKKPPDVGGWNYALFTAIICFRTSNIKSLNAVSSSGRFIFSTSAYWPSTLVVFQ